MTSMRMTQGDVDEILNIWQAIGYNMEIYRVKPEKLAELIGMHVGMIHKGLAGETVPIRHKLRQVALAFGFSDVRGGGQPKDEDYFRFLKPPPAMPPRQGHFWEHDDEI